MKNKYSKFIAPLSYFGDIRKFTSFHQVFKISKKYIISQFPVKKVSAFHYDFKKKSITFDFKTWSEIKLSPQEATSLVGSEKKYQVKEDHVYLCCFSESDSVHFILLEVSKDFNLLELDNFLEMLVSVIGNYYGYVGKHQSEKKMSSLAHTDDVTGLYNQRRLYSDIEKNIAMAKKGKGYFSLIFLDIDRFKNVNDEYGHIIGSKLLVQVAGVIRQVIRETDYIYRYGGDEFVIILPGAKTVNAKKVGERLLKRMDKQDFIAGSDQTFKLNLSLGIAEYPRDAKNREDILAMADKMMYEAKRAGRGRVYFI